MEKNYIMMGALPFLFMLVFSCSMEAIRENVDKEGEHGFSFRESKLEWEKLKAANGNSYVYRILEQSFDGRGSETTVEVEKAKVILRYYEAFEISEGSKTILYTYKEDSRDELGQHAEGAAPLTMDELYRTCVSEYLIANPETHEIYFDTNEEGVMNLCGYVPYGCQDDCYRGIRLSYFEWK